VRCIDLGAYRKKRERAVLTTVRTSPGSGSELVGAVRFGSWNRFEPVLK